MKKYIQTIILGATAFAVGVTAGFGLLLVQVYFELRKNDQISSRSKPCTRQKPYTSQR